MVPARRSSSSEPFARFNGELSGERATQLYRQRPLLNRVLPPAISALLVTGLCAGLWWFFSRHGQRISNDIAILIAWPFGIWCVLRLLSASYRGRAWAQNNRPFCGAYEAALFDQHLDVRNDGIAQRFQYLKLSPGRIDAGRTYVRVAFDLLGVRVLLLPVEDCRPPLTASELKAFLQQRVQTEHEHVTDPPQHVSAENLPLSFGLGQTHDSISVAGALHQAAAMNVLASERQQRMKPSRLDRIMTWFTGIMGMLVLGLIVAASVLGQQLPDKMIFLPLFLLVYFGISLYIQRPRSAKPCTSVDPSVSLAEITGWMSPDGFSAFTEHGSLSATWAACDAVEINDAQIVVKYWEGEFILFGRHIFSSEADWRRCVEWIQTVRSPRTAES